MPVTMPVPVSHESRRALADLRIEEDFLFLDLDQSDSRRKELAIFRPLRATSKRNAGGYHIDSAIQLSFRLRNELRSMR
jgi:hypothetical protein